MRILSIGEVLCDVFADGARAQSEHIGGAPLNFAFHAARLGDAVEIVSAVGEDSRGQSIVEFAERFGVGTRFLKRHPDYPTGVVTVNINHQGQPVYRIESPAAYQHVSFTGEDYQALRRWAPQGVYFGTLFHAESRALETTRRVLATCEPATRFYDVNLRPGTYSPELVRHLARMATILKVNDEEAPEVAEILGTGFGNLEEFARRIAARHGYQAVCITRGAEGCSTTCGLPARSGIKRSSPVWVSAARAVPAFG